jgi:hypothetical protein
MEDVAMPERQISTGLLGDELGVQGWRIARLFETGLVPEPPRVAGRRLIPESMVPEIVRALEEKGWLGSRPHGRTDSSG